MRGLPRRLSRVELSCVTAAVASVEHVDAGVALVVAAVAGPEDDAVTRDRRLPAVVPLDTLRTAGRQVAVPDLVVTLEDDEIAVDMAG